MLCMLTKIIHKYTTVDEGELIYYGSLVYYGTLEIEERVPENRYDYTLPIKC